MKRAVITALTIGMISLLPVHAAEKTKQKQKTVTGIAKCAKCALKESDTCQNVIEVRKGNKKTVYYLADNDVSKAFHENICKEGKNVKATLTVTKANGKKVYTATQLDLVEAK